MENFAIVLRPATAADLPGITEVRISVEENLLTLEQLAERGITHESVAASFDADAKGWVMEHKSEIVGFAIAYRDKRSIFALFVLPQYQGRGLGTRLLDRATSWLWQQGSEPIWLTTGASTKAVAFYEGRGWQVVGTEPDGQARLELSAA